MDVVVPVWLWGLLGLMVGSFLNVVIHRLPLMLHQQWSRECDAYLAETAATDVTTASPAVATHTEDAAPLNLMRPGSRCGHCGHVIKWYENIPVLSYIALRGRCSQCGQGIGMRYPAVELFTAAAFAWCAHLYPENAWLNTLVWCGYAATLIALAAIDWDTGLLPDNPTLPLMWAGLLASTLGLTGVTPVNAIVGAASGYMSLWLIVYVFKLLTGKVGMGHGDFKLMAVLGAWWGWMALVPLLLLSCVLGLVAGLWFRWRAHGQIDADGRFAFGPYLAAAGLLALVVHPLRWLGFVGL